MYSPRVLISGTDGAPTYVAAILGAGGTPVLSTPPEIDMTCDALLLCGGGDIHPSYYGEEINGSYEIDEARDAHEFALARAYVAAGKPILGICRGHQLLNVLFGGTLIQHLPTAEQHTPKNGFFPAHPVRVIGDNFLFRLYGARFVVNTSHHQAVGVLGRGLVPLATWEDAHIEAFAHESLPVFGVQWHPERLAYAMRREDADDGAPIFTYFLSLCAKPAT